jgi:hypothetical protein
MHRYLLSLSAAGILSFAFCSAAPAAGITSADLSGKKICWDNGSASSYDSSGHYSNNVSGEGTWAVTAGGVSIHTQRYDYVAAMQKLPNGAFRAEIAAAGMTLNGKYCN